MKQIEEGCLALIIKSENGHVGKVVRVGKFLGKVPFRKTHWKGEDRWEIDLNLTGFLGDTELGLEAFHYRDKWMQRIDGGKIKEEIKASMHA